MCGQAPELSRLAQPSSQKTTGGICLHPAAPGPAPPLSAGQTCKRGCSLDPSGRYRSQVRPLGPREPPHRPQSRLPLLPPRRQQRKLRGVSAAGAGQGASEMPPTFPAPSLGTAAAHLLPGSLLRVALGAQGRDSVPGGSGPGRCSPAILLTSSRTQDSGRVWGRRRPPIPAGANTCDPEVCGAWRGWGWGGALPSNTLRFTRAEASKGRLSVFLK